MASVFDTLLKFKDIEIFVTALQIADLDRTLNTAGEFTIFAPNNRAFTSLPKLTLQKLSQNSDLLTKLLSMHIIHGKLKHEDLLKMYDSGERKVARSSINGIQLEIDLNDGIKIGDSSILSVDASADNGIIYPIDRVIRKMGDGSWELGE
ncbi:fasciclin domain-containing protein [Chamaesiphon sp. GL140_3_metabinner_50]|uniref:fasciclin domain-containing protein n=1 Tax=Chamaesiphon sp. GL140_3_metabinner_50 TaxID=2970812 RepID=UPI0025DACC0D|nr:fasciclin domain-containing protein [Chamaesiphon sp. GL140_3_metabinner_50]